MSDSLGIQKAAAVIKSGGLLAFPTETLYGLGCDAFNAAAVRRVYEVKKRPINDPLIILIASNDELSKIVSRVNGAARELIEKHWPGALTIIFPVNKNTPPEVVGGGDTVAVRLPGCEVTRRLIRAAGTPLVAPSANIRGEEPPTTAAGVLKTFDGKIDAVLDSGETKLKVASTIVDATGKEIRVLRQGSVVITPDPLAGELD